MTQYEVIERHLKEHGTITSWQAFEMYGITRLSDIIYRLRKANTKIDSIDHTTKNRFGNNVNYTEYILVENEN